VPSIIRIQIIIITSLWILLGQCSVAVAAEPGLDGPSATVKEGYFTLRVKDVSFYSRQAAAKGEHTDNASIKLDKLNALHIEQSSTADFTEVAASFPLLGDFKQITLTGFADGRYWFRVRGEDTNGTHWYSAPLKIDVKHYPLWQAFGLFGIGAVMFVILAYYLLRAHLRVSQRQGD